MARLRVTILGCGSSGGVPRLGGEWGACDPGEPRNFRRRCSILIERIEGEARTAVLIDTSPDMRAQLLAADVSALDAVAWGAMNGPLGRALIGARGQRFHLAGKLELSSWNGRERLRLRLDDAAPA